MENYFENPFRSFLKEVSQQPSSIQSITNPALTETVMPLYQVIRFAHQAYEKNQLVSITIEQQLPNGKYTRSLLKGTFRTRVNQKKQITFYSHNHSVLHLLKVEQVLSIQLLNPAVS